MGFCVHHHRGEHQAPGWSYELLDDGTLVVTTPSGLAASTSPSQLGIGTGDAARAPDSDPGPVPF
ncbi:hypothetical protein GB931_03865 [Modestobacter sp. I12A-02628]|uniref:HNH endonuclease n=1 Tax=Goekera deserti TaxID=2497753 RepID=A0A7K3WIU1_9ACTN|nr:hypothetical protein [Goekera deserti]MPQ97075.1 hypothetical protein [Goekera deserti]NDI46608.1 hypothetical protein [Goekera deserti]NEL56364.1 hypothetical protein [Goekera deserti]